VDTKGALSTPLAALFGQNIAIAAAALSAAFALRDGYAGPGAIACVIGLSCVAKLASVCSKLSVENHWAKSLAGEDRTTLANLNGTLRSIDLSCKILAPGLAGVVMSLLSPAAAGICIGALNIIAWPIEALCLSTVHKDPWCQERLERPRDGGKAKPKDTGAPSVDVGEKGGFALYFSQQGLWPSMLALSLLHLTVLSFGQLMTAYVMTLGVEASIIAVYRGGGEVFGLIATKVAPKLVEKFGPHKAATFFIWFQLTMLIPSVIGASQWARQLPGLASSMLLVGGVGVSRLGLWGFDLSVTQKKQEGVTPQAALGRVSGVQNSFESFFGASAAAVGIFLCQPTQFMYLACGSWCSVASAAMLHSFVASAPANSDDSKHLMS